MTATFEAGDGPPLDLLEAWIDESYRMIAPKKIVAALAAGEPGAVAATQRNTRIRKKPGSRPRR